MFFLNFFQESLLKKIKPFLKKIIEEPFIKKNQKYIYFYIINKK